MGYKTQAGGDDSVAVLQYWPRHSPIPEGWHYAGDFGGSHHSHYSILIRKDEDNGQG